MIRPVLLFFIIKTVCGDVCTFPNGKSECVITSFVQDNIERSLSLTAPSPELVTVLSISGAKIQTLPNICGEFVNLQYVSVNGVKLQTIAPDAFDGCNKLEILDLSSNELAGLGSRFLEKLPSLKKIYLNENNLTKISSDVFWGSKKLEEINLASNKILELDVKGILTNCPKLQKLEFNGNFFNCDKLEEYLNLLGQRGVQSSVELPMKRPHSKIFKVTNGYFCLADPEWYEVYVQYTTGSKVIQSLLHNVTKLQEENRKLQELVLNYDQNLKQVIKHDEVEIESDVGYLFIVLSFVIFVVVMMGTISLGFWCKYGYRFGSRMDATPLVETEFREV